MDGVKAKVDEMTAGAKTKVEETKASTN
jgi:hypothetical protein